jgi:hypothetical protein
VWTSTAHLALRAVLHPVLARPVVLRGYLPIRALLGQLFSPILVDIGTVDIRNCDPHAWPPHRRRHPSLAPREVRPNEIHFSNESVKPLFTFFVLVLPPTSQSFACSAGRGCENMAALLRAAGNGMARRARDTASSFAVASQQVSARAALDLRRSPNCQTRTILNFSVPRRRDRVPSRPHLTYPRADIPFPTTIPP